MHPAEFHPSPLLPLRPFRAVVLVLSLGGAALLLTRR